MYAARTRNATTNNQRPWPREDGQEVKMKELKWPGKSHR